MHSDYNSRVACVLRFAFVVRQEMGEEGALSWLYCGATVFLFFAAIGTTGIIRPVIGTTGIIRLVFTNSLRREVLIYKSMITIETMKKYLLVYHSNENISINYQLGP